MEHFNQTQLSIYILLYLLSVLYNLTYWSFVFFIYYENIVTVKYDIVYSSCEW